MCTGPKEKKMAEKFNHFFISLLGGSIWLFRGLLFDID